VRLSGVYEDVSLVSVVRRHPHLSMVALGGSTADHIRTAHHIEPFPWTGDEYERTLANAKYHYDAHHPRRRDV
jgi:hypothetical protein